MKTFAALALALTFSTSAFAGCNAVYNPATAPVSDAELQDSPYVGEYNKAVELHNARIKDFEDHFAASQRTAVDLMVLENKTKSEMALMEADSMRIAHLIRCGKPVADTSRNPAALEAVTEAQKAWADKAQADIAKMKADNQAAANALFH